MEIATTPWDKVLSYLPFIIPLVLLQLILMVVCLVDLSRREKTWGPKWLWAIVILLGQLVGPIVYLIVGRKE